MTHAHPPLTKDWIDALAASAVGWALRLLCVLFVPGAERRAALHRFVQRLERHVERVVFLKAVLRTGPLPRRPHHPGARTPGFRRRRGSVRHFLKSARIRARGATLLGRVARLIAALVDGEAYIAHYARRLARGIHFGGMVACAPPAIVLAGDAPCACTFADSS